MILNFGYPSFVIGKGAFDVIVLISTFFFEINISHQEPRPLKKRQGRGTRNSGASGSNLG
jgi:hypothetical protein